MHNYISSTQQRASVMDYPPPVIEINKDDKLDFSKAYTNQIGDWDKLAIRYGYTDLSGATNEVAELNNIFGYCGL